MPLPHWDPLTEAWILKKKSWDFLSNFPDLKIVKSLGFFFQSYDNKCLISEIFFHFGQIVFNCSLSLKKLCSWVFLRSLLTTDLSDNFESGKRNCCLGKRSGKSIEFIFWYMCKAGTVVEKRISSGFLMNKEMHARFIRKDNFLSFYLLIS